MAVYSGILYDAGTLTGTGNTGTTYLPFPLGTSWAAGDGRNAQPMKSIFLRYVPLNLATDETLDLVLAVAWTAAGAGTVDLHTFTQTTSTNAVQNVLIPGSESSGILTVATKAVACVPPYFKLSWTLAGTTKSMTFTIYYTAEW